MKPINIQNDFKKREIQTVSMTIISILCLSNVSTENSMGYNIVLFVSHMHLEAHKLVRILCEFYSIVKA